MYNVERCQSNNVLAWEGTAADFAVSHLEQISPFRVQRLKANKIRDSTGSEREVDAAAYNCDMTILVEYKSMASVEAVTQLVTLRQFIR